jgi:Concanavalin A-like lectin/glucanases superfamily
VHTPRHHRFVRAAAAIIVTVACAGTTAATGLPRSPAPAQAVTARAATPRPGGGSGLSAAQAMSQAKASHQPVLVTSLTTATSQTTARPDGKFVLHESLGPVRAWRAGRWQPLDPTLTHAGGRISPQVTTSGLSLSGGGAGPLAVMSALGRTLTLSWPTPLPAPVLSGPTATYRDVLPGADLIVTADGQGGFSDVLAIKNATAAASPALRSLRLGATATRGLTISTGSGGNLLVRANPKADPVFSAPAPRMWDSAPLPAGARTATDPASGRLLAVPSGLPAQSTAAGPGGGAHSTAVPLAASGHTITMTPPAAALTGPGVIYPIYIDPTFTAVWSGAAAAWTQIDSGEQNNASNWMVNTCNPGSGNPCLQVGYCDPNNIAGCNGIGVTRTMFRMPVPSLPSNTTVDTADIYLEDVWTTHCGPEPLQLWTTNKISSSTNWNNNSGWTSLEEQETFTGYGYPGCGYSSKDVVFGTASGSKSGVSITGGSASAVASKIQSDIKNGSITQTFGLRSPDESTSDGTAWLQWRQFMTKSSEITMDLAYHNPPRAPNPVSINGIACHTSLNNKALIGNDDLTFSASASDPDGDTGLTTTFTVSPAGSTTTVASITTGGTSPTTTVGRTSVYNWQANGKTTAYDYQFTAQTKNSDGQTGPTTGPCYFNYNPTVAGAPAVSGFPGAVQLGQTVTNVTFAPPSGMTCPGNANCPASYTYQLGTAAPTTVSSSKPGTGTWSSSDTWTGSIPINQLGPLQLTVSSTNSAGNPGKDYYQPVTSTSSAPLADGYFSGGSNPDLLYTGTGAKPSLWLAPGTGNGSVGTPRDIGSLGDGINPGSGGPGDWQGATILHGDFTGHGVQDIMAYYPASGSASILSGVGAAITADPQSTFWPQSQWNIFAPALCDSNFDNTCADEPATLVAAGNASQQNPDSVADLIGTLGDATHGYELILYTPNGTASYGATITALASPNTAPDPADTNWLDYKFATAELPDSSNPNGDPANIALFALNTKTGTLWESTNPHLSHPPDQPQQDCTTDPAQSICSIVGTPSTWTKITGTPWGTKPPALVSADATHGARGPGSGSIELWTMTNLNGLSATAYTVSGTTLTTPTATPFLSCCNDWPLTDGSPSIGGSTATATATDTITGNAARISGTYSWSTDPMFSTALDFSGTSNSYAVPPAGTVSDALTYLSISVWFKTSTPNGVLASLQTQAVTPGSTLAGGYDPALYIGTDGKLHGEWYQGCAGCAMTSTTTVDDGLWHHAVLLGNVTTQTLYVDGQAQATLSGTISLLGGGGTNNPTNLTIGAGYLGGHWPTETYSGKNGTVDYFNGQLANVQFNT